MKRIPALNLLCAIILFTSIIVCFAADKPGSDLLQDKVSLDVKDASAGSVIEALFKGKNLNYSIDPGINDIMIPSLVIRDVAMRDAIASILNMTGLEMRSKNNIYMFSLSNKEWKTPVSVSFNNIPLQDALQTLFNKTNYSNWKVDANVPNVPVTYTADNAPFITVLSAILKPAGARFGWGHISAGDPLQKQVNLEFKDMPLSDAIDALLHDTGISYTIDPNTKQLKVTAVLKNITVDTALKQVLKTIGGFYRVDGGVYIISSRPDINQSSESLPGLPQTSSAASGMTTSILDLKYIKASDIAPIIHWGQVSTTSGNKLVITGTETQIAEASKIVQALDVESALAKPIRLKLTVEIVVNTAKGPKTYDSDTESVGADGNISSLNLEFSTAPTSRANTNLFNPGANISAMITPTLGPNNSISLVGNGRFAFRFGPNGESTIVKEFDVAASAVSGKPIVIAAGAANIDNCKANFTVKVIATPEQGRVQTSPSQDNNKHYQDASGMSCPAGNSSSSYGSSSTNNGRSW